MKRHTIATLLLACGCAASPYGDAAATSPQSGADPEITAFIGKIRAVDNHSLQTASLPATRIKMRCRSR
jgi:hypothetical protein